MLIEYLSYDFVQYALIVGTLIALCSALLGSLIVPKQMSFIGDGLSHICFGSAIIASVLSFSDNLLFELGMTILFSLLLFRNSKRKRLPNDAFLLFFSTGGLVCGYMVLNLFSKSANLAGDACMLLFGSTSILTLTFKKAVICGIFSIIIISLFFLFYHKLFVIAFDEEFSKILKINKKYQLLLILMIDTTIVLSMHLVGALLISALIVAPVTTSMQVCNSFKHIVCLSSFLSVLGAVGGILISIIFSTPVGCTIVVADIILLIVCLLIRK